VDETFAARIDQMEREGTGRELRTFVGPVGRRMRLTDRDVVMFSSGSYLDLAGHSEVIDAAARGAREYGAAASGSRLITGNLPCHDRLEAELALFYGKESALLLDAADRSV
jgi:7-keto-8-aminopelargonate synthetase-like enzyme